MTSHKKWKSFAEQLRILQGRGLEVDNEDTAIKYLERVGYYRLSGYWYPFRNFIINKNIDGMLEHSREDEFIARSHFADAVNLYVFDKRLRLLAMDALERIELAIRVDIAHLLGEKDPHAHEKPEFFHGHFSKKKLEKGKNKGMTSHDLWITHYKTALHRSRKTPFVKHYKKKYGRLPIWVAIETWDFGMTSKLFAGMKFDDKDCIAKNYGLDNGRRLEGWLRSLNFIRNVSAHHSRLWNINILELSKPVNFDVHWEQLHNSRPFFYFCVMKVLMDKICPNSTWVSRFSQLLETFPDPECKAVKLADFGLIENWKSWSLWEMNREPTRTQK